MRPLTPKQEQFCTKYVECGNASEAYRFAYDVSKMKPASVNRKAKELLDNGKISARLDHLRQGHSERHEVTIDSILQEYSNAIERAQELGQMGPVISAITKKAELFGLFKKHNEQQKDSITVKNELPECLLEMIKPKQPPHNPDE